MSIKPGCSKHIKVEKWGDKLTKNNIKSLIINVIIIINGAARED
jgi:hypothetical protein